MLLSILRSNRPRCAEDAWSVTVLMLAGAGDRGQHLLFAVALFQSATLGVFLLYFRDVGVKITSENVCVEWGKLVLLLECVVEVLCVCPVWANIHSSDVDWV
jgi:hypothetical protein